MAFVNNRRRPAARQFLRAGLGFLALLVSGTVACAQSATSVPANKYVPQAHFVDVQRSFVPSGTAAVPGAGVRAFQDPEPEAGGTERFELRWYANPPGLPPGVVLLLETIQERSATIKNHVLRSDRKSEGHVRSVIEITPEQIRQAGRILKWRARIVWRGRLLATRTCPDWDG